MRMRARGSRGLTKWASTTLSTSPKSMNTGLSPLVAGRSTHVRSAIADTGVPNDVAQMRQILSDIRAALSAGHCVYVHCRAGIGRTGLVIGCFLAEDQRSGKVGLRRLNSLWRESARAESWPRVPQTSEQADYIQRWPKLRSQDLAEGRMTLNPAAHDALLPAPQGPLIVTPLDPDLDAALLLSVVVPTFNEALNIHRLVTQLAQLLDGPFGDRYEIIVVDDDSPDRTWELAQSLAVERPRLQVMRRESERGLSSAVIRGWQAARGEFLCVIDADLQHPPDVTLELYRVMERGADMAVASRHVEGRRRERLEHDPPHRLARRPAHRAADASRRGGPGERSLEWLLHDSPQRHRGRAAQSARLQDPDRGPRPRAISLDRRSALCLSASAPTGGSKATLGVYFDYLRHLLRLRTLEPTGQPLPALCRWSARRASSWTWASCSC